MKIVEVFAICATAINNALVSLYEKGDSYLLKLWKVPAVGHYGLRLSDTCLAVKLHVQ